MPTYVNRPLAGDVGSLAQFVASAKRTGTALLAGSGWRFNDIVQGAAVRCVDCRVDSVPGMIGKDPFYYGIHLVEMLLDQVDSN